LRLKEWREAEGKTQAEVAAHLGVEKSSVYRWENNGRDPDAATKRRIFLMSGGKVEPNDWYDLPGWKVKLTELMDRLISRAA